MNEAVKKQFEGVLGGLGPVVEFNQKLAESTLRSNEIAIESLSQMARERLEFNRSCQAIGERRAQALVDGDFSGALFGEPTAFSEYYAATADYFKALRQNAEDVRERLNTIGRETLSAVTQRDGKEASASKPAASATVSAKATKKEA